MIDEKMARGFVAKIAEILGLVPRLLSYEIQEDWKFLLVLIEVPDSFNEADLKSTLMSAQNLARTMLPWRTTEYSWMVNAVRRSEVVGSVFGGNLASPHSGEEAAE